MTEKEAIIRIHCLRNNIKMYREKIEKLQKDPGHDIRFVKMYEYMIMQDEMKISDLHIYLKG